MDVRTLFLAQTCMLVATASMLWLARSETDRFNGLRTWTLAVTSQGIAYLLLAGQGHWPLFLSALLGNLLGAVSVALFFVAIRQFLGRSYRPLWLIAMILVVTAAACLTGANYAGATILNGFIYGLIELLNGATLWRRPDPEQTTVQRAVALAYLLMGVLLPMRATALLWLGSHEDYLAQPLDWQQPVYAFGLVYLIVTNLGFVQLCKMRAEAEVRRQAMSDSLTGLPNRRALNDAMVHALAISERSQQPFALLMIDLDHFKGINDLQGHAAGDSTLAAFAQRMKLVLRAQDLPFRYGGEEFCVLLPDTGTEGAHHLAERLRQQVAVPADERSAAISASIGIAVWQRNDNASSLFDRADRALYRAKAAGRDRVELG